MATSASRSSEWDACEPSTTRPAASIEATDVLSFPIDEQQVDSGRESSATSSSARRRATDVTEAAVHGTLHLCGFDHETDDGEMIELQAKVMASLR